MSSAERLSDFRWQFNQIFRFIELYGSNPAIENDFNKMWRKNTGILLIPVIDFMFPIRQYNKANT